MADAGCRGRCCYPLRRLRRCRLRGSLCLQLVADVLSVAPGCLRVVGPPLVQGVPDDPSPVASAVSVEAPHEVPAGADSTILPMWAAVSAACALRAPEQTRARSWCGPGRLPRPSAECAARVRHRAMDNAARRQAPCWAFVWMNARP